MSKSVREILIESLKGELQAVDFYLAVAEDAVNAEVQHYARQFATEEEKHFHLLVDWLEQDGSPTLQAVLQEIRLFLGTPAREPAAIKAWKEKYRHAQTPLTLQTLLEVAIAKEGESIGYFRELERQVDGPLARRVVGKIRQDEEQHKRFLEQQYTHLLRERGPDVP